MIKKIFSDKLFVALFILYSVAFLVVAIAGASGAFNKYNTMREFSETGALGFVLFAYITSICGIGIMYLFWETFLEKFAEHYKIYSNLARICIVLMLIFVFISIFIPGRTAEPTEIINFIKSLIG
ncbi:hypothetical protein [Helicobacter pullorum]|uniref:Uncharacterized protein n=1 Tax=Helicobacter pullorum TaxID=35818 RepID=A0A377Q2H0_9HELI|nr:hypothetical protein [Helicobacter pullorum]STQ88968.1 Uncharacterised protein [Helicobacter pullorum]